MKVTILSFMTYFFLRSMLLFAQNNNALTGDWQYSDGYYTTTLTFKADGTGAFDGEAFRYTASGGLIKMSDSENNTITYQYVLSGNKMTLSGGDLDQPVVFTKTGANNNQSSNNPTAPVVPKQNNNTTNGIVDKTMVGKWCYVSNLNLGAGSSATDECFVLYENGTYEYSSEYSSSGSSGSTYSNNADRGTWKVQGNKITAQSNSGQVYHYTFEKKNHPKNGDPMLVLDGRAYVTYYQKSPW